MKANEVYNMLMYRESTPPRVYHPTYLQPVLEAIKDGDVLNNTIKVEVKDSYHEFNEGFLPCQKVTISFDYIRIRTDRGEIPFDREMINCGYLSVE